MGNEGIFEIFVGLCPDRTGHRNAGRFYTSSMIAIGAASPLLIRVLMILV